MRTDTIPTADARPGAAWPDVGRPVPRHVAVAAHLTALTVLPSGVWRVVLGCGVTLGFARADLEADGIPGRGTVMVVFLTVLTEALALLTLGLVKPWGEVVPRWVPALGGRRVPPAAAVVPAAIGGILLTHDLGVRNVGRLHRSSRRDHRHRLAGADDRLLPAGAALGTAAPVGDLALPPPTQPLRRLRLRPT